MVDTPDYQENVTADMVYEGLVYMLWVVTTGTSEMYRQE